MVPSLILHKVLKNKSYSQVMTESSAAKRRDQYLLLILIIMHYGVGSTLHVFSADENDLSHDDNYLLPTMHHFVNQQYSLLLNGYVILQAKNN